MKLLDRADLEALGIKYSASQLYRKEREGRFPRSVKLSGVRKAWPADEIESWIKARMAERDQETA